jgi:hypothetical protein
MKSPGGLRTLVWLVPLALAAIYVVVFVAQFHRDITELAWSSDYASGFTVPETIVAEGKGTHMLMGSAAEWVPLWFGLLTARLPLHRTLWEVIPTLLFIATVLTVGWSVARVADRRAGILAVLLGFVLSPLALVFLMAPVAHNTVYLCTALLGAYVVWLTLAERRRLAFAIAVPLLAGVVLGLCLASDSLVAVSAVVPLGVTAILAGLRRERRSRIVSASAIATIVVALPVAKLTSSVMYSAGYLKETTPAEIVPLSQLPERAKLLFKGLKALFNGYLGVEKPGFLHTPLGFASDVVMSAALLALVALGAISAVRLIVSGLPKRGALAPVKLARSLHIVYWVVAAGAACGSFWLAAETGGGTNLHESYYGVAVFSVAAVIPLLLSIRSPLRWLLPAGVAVYFAASLAGLTSNYVNVSPAIEAYAPTVERVAESNHVTTGYGGYGWGSSLTWQSHGRVTVRPVEECQSPEGVGFCPFYLVAPTSWYVPRRRKTFLIVDGEEPWLSQLPAGLGKPLTGYEFGAIRVYIYPYDIAERLGPVSLGP